GPELQQRLHHLISWYHASRADRSGGESPRRPESAGAQTFGRVPVAPGPRPIPVVKRPSSLGELHILQLSIDSGVTRNPYAGARRILEYDPGRPRWGLPR